MSLTKVTYSMILGADSNVLDTGASSDGATNNQTAVQATLNKIDGIDGSTGVSNNNVRISTSPTIGLANVIPFKNLQWPDNADVWFQGTVWETILLKNQFSNPYQVLPVVTTSWVGSTLYYVGDKVVNGGQAYQCTLKGTSASSGGPTGTGTNIVDGTAEWRSINNGYYGEVPVNEFRVHAPYHPGIVLNNLTKDSYNGVVQRAHQDALDQYAAGGGLNDRLKSIVFAQDNQGQWDIQVDGYTTEMIFTHYTLGGTTQLYRMYFSGDYGNLGLQQGRANYPLDVAGQGRIIQDVRPETPVRSDNYGRYPGPPRLWFQYIKTGSDFAGWIGQGGSTGYNISINSPAVAGTDGSVSLNATNASGTAYGISVESFYPSFQPSPDNTMKLGNSSNRWTTVYATTGTINTSDERLKEQIKPIDDAALRAWEKVEYVQYKWKDAIEAKGDGARWHFGLIAQRVKEAFESEGLNAFEYGLLCYDKWEAQTEDKDENGHITKHAQEAGDRYGIRYEEALALECAYLRSKLK